MSKETTTLPIPVDVLVIGGGQSALATSYFLRRAAVSYLVLDDQPAPGGAWQHAWDSLSLFSPAQWSSLPGWLMPSMEDEYPSRDHVVRYLAQYEVRYEIPVRRNARVISVSGEDDGLLVSTDDCQWLAQTVVSATGSWSAPFIPTYPGQETFGGIQMHSAQYKSPERFKGKDVLVIGGGNSGAQIQAELSQVCNTTWVTVESPTFLPDDVDGRVLFERATLRWKARAEGRPDPFPSGGLGHIVMIPPVREARERGVMHSVRPFSKFVEDGVVWADGARAHVDAVLWCTGFRPALQHLGPLHLINDAGQVDVLDGRATQEPRLWLVGYGDWCGFASATLIGVMRTARSTVAQITEYLNSIEKEIL
ncbi:ArsO family NAD(P)H-dependent flavin-containing monooxygenase [Caballeronia sp. DA-9]|uniref:ArsO family NAD(P)H-dependent flavin-containing monooxygenase n=1 Tax=Caballeronia sp. DA-9 TaxID=3436237 RepID=UPI003F66D903